METEIEIYRLQGDIKRNFNPVTQTFTRSLADQFEACLQTIIFNPTTGEIIGYGKSQIVPITLDPDKVDTPSLKQLATQIKAGLDSLQPLIAQATIETLQSLNSTQDPEGVASWQARVSTYYPP